jgi:hypothetical protein
VERSVNLKRHPRPAWGPNPGRAFLIHLPNRTTNREADVIATF